MVSARCHSLTRIEQRPADSGNMPARMIGTGISSLVMTRGEDLVVKIFNDGYQEDHGPEVRSSLNGCQSAVAHGTRFQKPLQDSNLPPTLSAELFALDFLRWGGMI